MRRNGEVTLLVLVAIVVVGAGFFVLKPLFSRDKKRAKESVQTTEQLIAAVNAQGASAAASVATIGAANVEAPDSPAKNFIAREVPVALSQLPAPDPKALIEAEKRKVAVMEGRLEEANKLYETVAKKAERLQSERDDAIAAKRASDQALVEAAAAKAAAEQQRRMMLLALVGVGAVAGFFWFYRISPSALGRIAADIRAGIPATHAFDAHTTPIVQRFVNRAARLATPSQ